MFVGLYFECSETGNVQDEVWKVMCGVAFAVSELEFDTLNYSKLWYFFNNLCECDYVFEIIWRLFFIIFFFNSNCVQSMI